MKVLVIILAAILIAAVVVIFHQKGRSDVYKEFLNLCLSRIKDLERENTLLKDRMERLSTQAKESGNKAFQGHH